MKRLFTLAPFVCLVAIAASAQMYSTQIGNFTYYNDPTTGLTGTAKTGRRYAPLKRPARPRAGRCGRL